MDFTKYSIETAPVAAKSVLMEVEKAYGMVPNLMSHLAESPVAAKGYWQLANLMEETGFSPVELQVIFLAISHENSCQYCMSAHSALAHMCKVPEQVTNALREGDKIDDLKLNALRAFTKNMVKKRGLVEETEVQEFLAAGYSKANILDVITAVAMKTLSNYSNHILKTEVDEAFVPFIWKA